MSPASRLWGEAARARSFGSGQHTASCSPSGCTAPFRSPGSCPTWRSWRSRQQRSSACDSRWHRRSFQLTSTHRGRCRRRAPRPPGSMNDEQSNLGVVSRCHALRLHHVADAGSTDEGRDGIAGIGMIAQGDRRDRQGNQNRRFARPKTFLSSDPSRDYRRRSSVSVRNAGGDKT